MKSMQGTVIRIHDQKTARVEVERAWQHPVYKKFVKRTKNYVCGIAEGVTLAVGDTVTLQESRPLSKTKHFLITEKAL